MTQSLAPDFSFIYLVLHLQWRPKPPVLAVSILQEVFLGLLYAEETPGMGLLLHVRLVVEAECAMASGPLEHGFGHVHHHLKAGLGLLDDH